VKPKLYPCPCNCACSCKMDEPCLGCEDYARWLEDLEKTDDFRVNLTGKVNYKFP